MKMILNDDIILSDLFEPEPEAPLPARQKGLFSRFRSRLFGVLVVIYILLIVVSGYWYMSRPVRSEQISHAYGWWHDIAEIYHIPVPEDCRWN